jgi:hypothetical protein
MTPLPYQLKAKLVKPMNRKLSPYAQSFHGGEYHDDPTWVNKDIKEYRSSIQGLDTKLDDLIEFAVPPKVYPEAVMKSVWNKIKKPTRKTFGQIMRRHDPRSPIPTMVFRDQAHMLSAKLDELIEFQGFMNPALIQSLFGRAKGIGRLGQSLVGAAQKSRAALATGAERTGSAVKNVYSKLAAANRTGINPAISGPSAGVGALRGGVATGGSAGTDPLARFAAARAGANPAIATPIGGRAGMATGAPAILPSAATTGANTAAAAAAASPDAAKEVAHQAGAAGWKGKWGKRALGAGIGLAGAGVLASQLRDEARRQEMSALLDRLITFADPRPRNPLGQFSPQEGGPDPNAMATTYKAPQAQGGLGVGKAAGAALAGGALGAIGSNIGKAGYESAVKAIKDLAKKRAKL